VIHSIVSLNKGISNFSALAFVWCHSHSPWLYCFLLCPFSLCLLLSHARSPSLPNDAKEVIIDALCHDCSRDLCANYIDSRVIIIGRVSHNYGFAFHSHDMICLNGVLIVCNFDRLLDIHVHWNVKCMVRKKWWWKWVMLCHFFPPPPKSCKSNLAWLQ